ncbi:aminotransferase class I/II-fold pyridoxal phosphate-dependent enzyme [Bacillus sp. H-16]|uniref:GntG family PLP-dependent aldolase n=1 Tax=Alteribacter salitolerans TaxID=2912333 RepID=UPI0019659D74|nr:GntG family PLP-dependent aldolase [Alteribacter salitolerans]MBM7095171.1 aminotransferase class I/II-fold pyridoxal phosphate-dependent enzyme [Alteribacter salitolerans]
MIIDLRSDTVTQPTQEMRAAMSNALVGDDVYEEDPTIKKLESMSAKLLGKESALFVTSGTQGNLIAVLSQTKMGDEVILDENSHLFFNETGALASIASVQSRTLKGNNGKMLISDIIESIRGEDIHHPKTSLICLENPHARAGGRTLSLSYMKEVFTLSKEQNISVHLDGSRIFNAAIELEVNPHDIAQYTDTVQFCLSKGLSAPVGSVLVGPKEIIVRARKWRKALGGGTRQIGVIGAAGIVALEDMINRLVVDHDNAKELALGLKSIVGDAVSVENTETNIVMLSARKLGFDAANFINLMKLSGILANAQGKDTVRFVTHRHITKKDIKQTISIVKNIINKK